MDDIRTFRYTLHFLGSKAAIFSRDCLSTSRTIWDNLPLTRGRFRELASVYTEGPFELLEVGGFPTEALALLMTCIQQTRDADDCGAYDIWCAVSIHVQHHSFAHSTPVILRIVAE